MSFIDVAKLSQPISADEASGINLEYEPLYLQLEELAFGTPSQELGGSQSEGIEPDRRSLKETCLSLFKQTRDLQVAVYLALSALSTNGLQGFSESIELISIYIDDLWDTVWPQLDPDDDNDPLERINILSALSPPLGTYEDIFKFNQLIHDVPLCDSKQLGKYSLRDVMISTGELESSENKKVDSALINAAFMDTDPAKLQKTVDNAQLTIDLLKQISTSINNKTETSIDFSKLTEPLINIVNTVSKNIVQEEKEITIDDTQSDDLININQEVTQHQTRQSIFSPNTINNREDVIKAIDTICDYYDSYEPASPVPLLLRRAKKMAAMNFLELIEEVSPNGVEQALTIFGRQPSPQVSETNQQQQQQETTIAPAPAANTSDW